MTDMDGMRRATDKEVQGHKARDDLVCEQGELGPRGGRAKKAGEDATELLARSSQIKEQIKITPVS